MKRTPRHARPTLTPAAARQMNGQAAATPPQDPPTKPPRPPAIQVLQSFLNQWGIVLVQGLGAERTEGGKMIVGPTLNALYKDQIQQQQAGQQQPQPVAPTPSE